MSAPAAPPKGGLLPPGVLEAIAHNLCSLHDFDPAFVMTQERFARAVITEYERAMPAPDFAIGADGTIAPAPVGGGEAVAWLCKNCDSLSHHADRREYTAKGCISCCPEREPQPLFASPLGGSGGGQGSLQAQAPSVPGEGLSPLVVALCESLRDNDDPNEPIADNGASVLDGWRDLAGRILAAAPSSDTAGEGE